MVIMVLSGFPKRKKDEWFNFNWEMILCSYNYAVRIILFVFGPVWPFELCVCWWYKYNPHGASLEETKDGKVTKGHFLLGMPIQLWQEGNYLWKNWEATQERKQRIEGGLCWEQNNFLTAFFHGRDKKKKKKSSQKLSWDCEKTEMRLQSFLGNLMIRRGLAGVWHRALQNLNWFPSP